MPQGITPSVIRDCLQKAMTSSWWEDLVQGRKLFDYTMSAKGNKKDLEALFKARFFLSELLSASGTTTIDKVTLVDGLKLFAANSQHKFVDVENQAYALKQMLMHLRKTRSNSTTGTRLAPWLSSLIALDKQDLAGDTVDSSVELPIVQLPTQTESVRATKLLKRMPSTPPDSQASSARLAPAIEASSARLAPAIEAPKPPEPSSSNDTKGKIVFFWDDKRGGYRICKGMGGIPEKCSHMEHGADGFVMCYWPDGTAWNSEVSNLDVPNLDLGDETGTFKRPASAAQHVVPSVDSGDESGTFKRPASAADEKKKLYSRVYHQVVKVQLNKGVPEDKAKQAAREEAKARVAEAYP